MAAAGRGPSKRAQEELYRQAMGEDALARQTSKDRQERVKKIACRCSQSSTSRVEEVGPYHRMSCPLYAPS